MTVSHLDANDPLTIVSELRNIKKYFFREYQRGIHVVTAIVGDQPIFKIVFRLWLQYYLEDDLSNEASGFALCKWMVPIPGGFHIDKQGIIPTVKAFLSGSGLKELARFSGLSKKNIEKILKLSHYRKCRRYVSQVTAAQLFRIIDVVRKIDQDVSEELRKLLTEESQRHAAEVCGQQSAEDRSKKEELIQELLPKGCKIQVSENVSPECIKLGQLIAHLHSD